MARQTCLDRPANKAFYSIQIHHLKLFQDDEVLAKLVFVFDYLSLVEIMRNDDPKDKSNGDDDMPDEMPWVEASLAKIRSTIGNTESRTVICERIKVLERLSVIDIKESVGKKSQYRLNVSLINRWCSSRHVIPVELLTGTDPDGSVLSDQSGDERVTDTGLNKNPSDSERVEGVYIGRIHNTKENKNPSVVPLSETSSEELEDQNLLSLSDSPEDFLQQSYSRTRRGKFRKTGQHSTGLRGYTELEDRFPPAEVRAAFLCFLDQEDEWLRANKWPLPYFVKNYGQKEFFRAPRNTWSLPDLSPAAVPPPSPSLDIEQMAEQWNQFVRSQPVTWIPGMRPSFSPSVLTEEFSLQFPALCAKCEDLLSSRPDEFKWYLNFFWLIGDKNGFPNWHKVIQPHWGAARRFPGAAVTTGQSLADQVLESLKEKK